VDDTVVARVDRLDASRIRRRAMAAEAIKAGMAARVGCSSVHAAEGGYGYQRLG
jgi:hypothetical protein